MARPSLGGGSEVGEIFTVGSPGDPDCDFASVQAAIGAAKDNGPGSDLIVLANNQAYTGIELNIDAHSVHIIGGFPNCTDIFGENTFTVLDASGGNHSVIDIFGTAGGPHTVILEDLHIQGSAVVGSGGGIEINGAMIVGLWDTLVTGNAATNGGGIFIDGTTGAVLDMQRASAVQFNTASIDGGGIFCQDGAAVYAFDDTAISFNSAGESGGGLYLDPCYFRLESGGPFQGVLSNQADSAGGFGGGIHARSGSTVELVGGRTEPATVAANQAHIGGGISIEGINSWLVALNAQIAENVADHIGGGIFIAFATLLMDRTLSAECHTVDRCSQLSFNTAFGEGGAIYIETPESEVEIRQTYIEGNGGGAASGGIVRSGRLRYESVVIAGNTSEGKTLASFEGGTLELAYATLADNVVNDLGNGAYVISSDRLNSRIDAASSVIWEDEEVFRPGTGTVFADCLIVNESATVLGADPDARFIMVVNPLFADPANGDYHLGENSPAVDYCDNAFLPSSSPDIDNESRGVDDPAVPDLAGPFDIGAD